MRGLVRRWAPWTWRLMRVGRSVWGGGGGFREGDEQAVVLQVFLGEGTARSTPGPAGAARALRPLDVRVGALDHRGSPTLGDCGLVGAVLVRPRAAGPLLRRGALTPALGTSPQPQEAGAPPGATPAPPTSSHPG